jgi:hypothetical protein
MFFVFGNRAWLLQIGALAYLANGLFALLLALRRPLSAIGWLTLAVGFFALSFAEDTSLPGRSRWRSPASLIGIASTLLGAALLIDTLLRPRFL